MELNKFVDELFNKAKNVGFNECEVYYVDRESLSIGVYKGEVEKYNLNNSYGLSFRGKINDKIGYSYTEILDEEAIEMLIRSAKESALKVKMFSLFMKEIKNIRMLVLIILLLKT